MSHTAIFYLVLFAISLVAGAINAVAGGGTLLTFPTLILGGVSSIVANATNTVALVTGSFGSAVGYWKYTRDSRSELIMLALPCLVGGFIGANWVSHLPDHTFRALIPWLIFAATGLFIVQEPINRLIASRRSSDSDSSLPTDLPRRAGLSILLLLVAVYGGFFGAGIGIMMLASLGFMGFAKDLHRANGIKTVAAVFINGIASVTFIVEHKVNWLLAAVMATGAIIGGYGGAGLAGRLGQHALRTLIIVIGTAIGISMFFTHR